MKHYRRKLDIQWIRIIWRTLIPKQIFYFRLVILTTNFSIVDFLLYFSLYLYVAPDYLFQFFFVYICDHKIILNAVSFFPIGVAN